MVLASWPSFRVKRATGCCSKRCGDWGVWSTAAVVVVMAIQGMVRVSYAASPGVTCVPSGQKQRPPRGSACCFCPPMMPAAPLHANFAMRKRLPLV